MNWSSASAESGLPATIFFTWLRLSALNFSARWRAYRPSAAISRAPKFKRAPAIWRIKAAPASGSLITRSMATMSATSGTCTNPPRPSTSQGISAAASAAWIAGICPRFRANTAKVLGALLFGFNLSGSFQSGVMNSTIAVTSASMFS